MQNRNSRQLRARLARRRTSPGRVRSRGEQQASPRSGIPWVHVGTAVGAVAAIGSVVFTGIATYYSALVSSDQLQQSREDTERGERQQAELVSYYFDPSREGVIGGVHVVNRSLDPVYGVEVAFSREPFSWSDGETAFDEASPTDIGPCSEIIYRLSSLLVTDEDGRKEQLTQGDPVIRFVHFTDRAGQRWLREPSRLSKRKSDITARPQGAWRGAILGEAELRKLDFCGDQPS